MLYNAGVNSAEERGNSREGKAAASAPGLKPRGNGVEVAQ